MINTWRTDHNPSSTISPIRTATGTRTVNSCLTSPVDNISPNSSAASDGLVPVKGSTIPQSLKRKHFVTAMIVGWIGASLAAQILTFGDPTVSVPFAPIVVALPFGAVWVFLLPCIRGRGLLWAIGAGLISVPIVLSDIPQ